MENMKKVLLIATYDSFLKTGLTIANAIDNSQIDIKIRITISNQLSNNQLNNIFHNQKYNYSTFTLNDYN